MHALLRKECEHRHGVSTMSRATQKKKRFIFPACACIGSANATIVPIDNGTSGAGH